MHPSFHCNLCDHQEKSLAQGTTCALTARKPEFSNTCSKITLNQKFEDRLKEVNIHYTKLQKQQLLTYVYFVAFLSIGLAVIAGGYLFGINIYDLGVISTVPFSIMAIGLLPLGMAIGTLHKHRQNLGSAKRNKAKVDAVLKPYNITYTIAIDFGKSYHGVQEVYADLKLKGLPGIR